VYILKSGLALGTLHLCSLGTLSIHHCYFTTHTLLTWFTPEEDTRTVSEKYSIYLAFYLHPVPLVMSPIVLKVSVRATPYSFYFNPLCHCEMGGAITKVSCAVWVRNLVSHFEGGT